ncbi:hypothetical protein JTB14_023483 [Gonioctena quinquepunctata]|nr:hypothetical protein JTB14_023483 [Gonioctena quinquepunctata]
MIKKDLWDQLPFFGEENEKKLANHIEVMQAKDFFQRLELAYLLAEQWNLNYGFNRETEKAGYDFVQLFLARSTSMNKAKVDAYFKLLENVFIVDDTMLEPCESYLQYVRITVLAMCLLIRGP